jgi:hypothetical protein
VTSARACANRHGSGAAVVDLKSRTCDQGSDPGGRGWLRAKRSLRRGARQGVRPERVTTRLGSQSAVTRECRFSRRSGRAACASPNDCSRPGQERRSSRPTRSLAREGGRGLMSRLSPLTGAFHRAGVAGHGLDPGQSRPPTTITFLTSEQRKRRHLRDRWLARRKAPLPRT